MLECAGNKKSRFVIVFFTHSFIHSLTCFSPPPPNPIHRCVKIIRNFSRHCTDLKANVQNMTDKLRNKKKHKKPTIAAALPRQNCNGSHQMHRRRNQKKSMSYLRQLFTSLSIPTTDESCRFDMYRIAVHPHIVKNTTCRATGAVMTFLFVWIYRVVA